MVRHYIAGSCNLIFGDLSDEHVGLGKSKGFAVSIKSIKDYRCILRSSEPAHVHIYIRILDVARLASQGQQPSFICFVACTMMFSQNVVRLEIHAHRSSLESFFWI